MRSSGFFSLTAPLDQPAYGCGMGEAFVRFWKKYATFKGRASRGEFWWWVLWVLIINVVLGLLPNVFGLFGASSRNTMQDITNIISYIFSIAAFIPTLAVSVRRLHDTNKPGWLLAIYYGIMAFGAVITVAGAVLLGAGAIQLALNGTSTTYSNSGGISEESSLLGVALVFVGLAIILITDIVYIVFMASKSNPAGVRFDAPYNVPAGYAPVPPAEGYYAPGVPQQEPYGAPYDEFNAPAPQAPMTQQNPYTQNYAAPGYATAEPQQTAPVVPPMPASPTLYTEPTAPETAFAEPQQPIAEQVPYDESKGNASNQQN